jgi:hypothetical protein
MQRKREVRALRQPAGYSKRKHGAQELLEPAKRSMPKGNTRSLQKNASADAIERMAYQ